MGIGDWGLGIGDWGLGIGPNPQSPIPNPQSPIPNPHLFLDKFIYSFHFLLKNYVKKIKIHKIINLIFFSNQIIMARIFSINARAAQNSISSQTIKRIFKKITGVID